MLSATAAFTDALPIPRRWEQHQVGMLPGTVFCKEPYCWCHTDPRKTAALGRALDRHLIDESDASKVQDGILPLPPEAILEEEEA